MSKPKVLNIFGEPGVGKSTLAASLFAFLKVKGYHCELCTEWIKDEVYLHHDYPFKRQIFTFANQLRKLDAAAESGLAICESPILLSLFYGDEPNSLHNLVLDVHDLYDNINIVLVRDFPYQTYGRLQDEVGAEQVRKDMLKAFDKFGLKYELIVNKDSELTNTIEQIYKLLLSNNFLSKED